MVLKDKYCDLHFHSIYSEGVLNCQQLIERAKKYDLKAIALTDHNAIDGCRELISLGKKNNIEVISGVEIYVKYKKWDLHLLGYGLDINNLKLNKILEKLYLKRLKTLGEAVTKLQKIGFKIDHKFLSKTISHYFGLGNLIRELERRPENVRKIKSDLRGRDYYLFNIIELYFAKGKKVALPETSMPIKLAIKAILDAGGIPVLAHPGQQLWWKEDHIILEFKKMDLRGIEVLTPYHNYHQLEHYQNFALKHKLIITGGSDFHDHFSPEPGRIIFEADDYFKVPYKIFENLKKNL